MSAKPAPTPWIHRRVGHDSYSPLGWIEIAAADGSKVTLCWEGETAGGKGLPREQDDQSAGYMILAVNAHAALVEALREILYHFGDDNDPAVVHEARSLLSRIDGEGGGQ